MIPTEEQHVNGHAGGICRGCRLEVAYAEVELGGVYLRLCVECAKAVAGWLSADLKVGCRQRGDYAGDFERTEKLVRTNLKMLRLLGVEPTDEELGSLMAHARGL